MAPAEKRRVKPTRGSYRIRRDLRRLGIGVLQISAHTTNLREFERRNAVVGKLIDDAQVDVLRALQAGRVTIEQLVDLDRRNELRGSQIMATVAMRRPLWETWEATAKGAGQKAETGKRYLVTMRQLRETLPESAKVGDLLGLARSNGEEVERRVRPRKRGACGGIRMTAQKPAPQSRVQQSADRKFRQLRKDVKAFLDLCTWAGWSSPTQLDRYDELRARIAEQVGYKP